MIHTQERSHQNRKLKNSKIILFFPDSDDSPSYFNMFLPMSYLLFPANI